MPLTLNTPAAYFGFDWLAGDKNDAISFYDGSTLLATYNVGNPRALELGCHSNQYPDLVPAERYRKAMHVFASHGHAAAVAEAKSPAVQRANHLSLLDPPLTQRAPGMRASVGKGNNRLTGTKKCDAQAQDLEGLSAALGDLFNATN